MAVEAMQAGAMDFIEKPVHESRLLNSVAMLLACSRHAHKASGVRLAARNLIATLTDRQSEILQLVISGSPSKNIAADLRISQRTVDNHRAAIMKKIGATSLCDLVRTTLSAA